MQVEHLFSYTLYHELWNQNLINEEGFIIANTKDLKRYKTFLEEQPIWRGAETHKNRKRILDKTQELLKFESLTASQEEDLHALLQSLQLDVGEDGYFVLRPDVQLPEKKYPGVREPSLSLWELKIDEAVRAKKILRRDLKTLDKWLGLIADSKAKVRKAASCETADWKKLENKCRKRTRDRLNEMEMKRRNMINSFHADNDYSWKNMCGMKVSPKKSSKGKSLETMSPLRQAAPHILAPPKSAIDRGFGVLKKESVERDDISKDPSFMQKASETAENMDANLDAASRLPNVFEKEKLFAFGDHVDLSPAEREARKAEKSRKRLKLLQRMIARKTAYQEEVKGKEQQKLNKTYSSVDKSKLASRESETSFKKDLRKVKGRRKRDAISVREDREISDEEKGVSHEEEILRKSEKFETLIKSENGEWRQDVVEDKMASKVTLSDRRECLVISETLSDMLNLVELNVDGEVKELKVEGPRNLKQSVPVVSGMLTLEVAELLKDMSCSVEINMEDEKKSVNLLLSDTTKVSIPRTYEEGRDDINETTCETIEDNLEVIGTFDDLLLAASEEPTRCHLEDINKLADTAGRDEINESTRETIEANLDVIETFDDLLNSITSEEPTKGRFKDPDQLTDAEGRYEVNESVRETVENNLNVIDTFDDFLDSIASEEPTRCHLENFDKLADAAGRDEISESTRETMEMHLDLIETFDDLLNSMRSKEPTKGSTLVEPTEDSDQLTNAGGSYEVNESVRETIEDNLDAVETFDDLLSSVTAEETIRGPLEYADQMIDAERKFDVNESVRETVEDNLDVIGTSDDLLSSVTAEETIKGHLEYTDQMIDAERKYEVNESVRETVEDNLDVIGTSDDFLDSIASEEPTRCHLENFAKLADAAGRDEINESTRDTIETNLDVIETFDDLLNSMRSKEPTKGHFEDSDQLIDAGERYEVNESVCETIEDNLDVVETFDDLLNSVTSEETTKGHLEDADQLIDGERRYEESECVVETIEDNLDVIETFGDLLNSITSEEPTKGRFDDTHKLTYAERRYKVNESVCETIEDNMDVIETFDDFLDSITSEEPTKGHFEDADQLTDAEGRDEVNESIRETIEEKLDLIEAFDDVLNSIASEETTESYLEDADKWKSTKRDISVQQNTENLVKDLIKDITDKLIETDLYSLHSESGEDLIDFDKEHRTEKWMEEVTDLEAREELADAKFIRACRIAAESKSFENEFPAEELLPKFCTFEEILTKCISPIKYTNTQEESLNDIESLRLKRTDIEEAGLEIQEEKHSSEILEIDISESTSRKLLTQKSIELESVQLIKARESLALFKNLETLPFIEYKPNICTIDEISEQCGSPSKLENIAEVPFRDVHSVREEAPFDLLGRETEGYTAEIPVEDILEATSQLITKESDTSNDIMKAISSSPKDKQSGVECEFEEIYLGVSTFSCLRSQEGTKRKSVEQNLLVLDPRRHEVPISISEIPKVITDDRKRDRYRIQKYSNVYSRDDSDVKIQGVEDSNLSGRSAKAGPSRSELHRGFRDSLRQNSLEKIKEKRLTLSSSRDKEHSRRISLEESYTSEVIPNFQECFHTIGEKLKNAERKLSILASKTGSSPRVLNGNQQKSRRSTVLPSRSKTQVSEQRRKTRSSISEKDQDQKSISSMSRETKPEQERCFKEDGAKYRQDKQIQAHPSTSGSLLPRRPSEKKDDSEPKPDETTQGKETLKRPWPAFVKVDTQNIAGISAAILEKTRALRANKGLILNKSLFSNLDECKYIKKDK